jgi:hypothetical protein
MASRFVTAGSPLASLYTRFLGKSINAIPGCAWENVYRASDYIAGPLEQKNIVDTLLYANYPANHVQYFDDPNVVVKVA